MIFCHVLITAAPDYATRREAHRQAHLGRIQGLRAAGAVVGGGPAPDGRTADLVYRLANTSQLKLVIEEDPYWTGGVWTQYTSRSFTEFVEPWEMVPLVIDGSRPATVVEGPVSERDMAQFALIEMRGAGRLAFGGLFDDGRTFALCKTADAQQAREWFEETGFWAANALTTRPLLHVL